MILDPYDFNDGCFCSVSFAGFSSSLTLTVLDVPQASSPIHIPGLKYLLNPDIPHVCLQPRSPSASSTTTLPQLTAISKWTCPESSSWPSHPACSIAVLPILVNASFILRLRTPQIWGPSCIPLRLSIPRAHPIHQKSFWHHLQNSYGIDTLLTPSWTTLLSSLLRVMAATSSLVSLPPSFFSKTCSWTSSQSYSRIRSRPFPAWIPPAAPVSLGVKGKPLALAHRTCRLCFPATSPVSSWNILAPRGPLSLLL